MKTKLIFSASLFLTLISCSHNIYIPAVADGAMQQQLMQGRELYLGNCGKCHRLHNPRQFNAEQWTEELEEMQPKAKITDEQRDLIYLYLTSEPEKVKDA